MLVAVVSVVLLVVGAVLLTAGAETFARNVRAASSRLGVSVLALGVLVAGAEPEEAVTAAVASAQGHPALAAGDAVGANLVILTLTLGLAATLTRLPVSRRVVEYAAAAALAGALAALFLRSGVMTRWEGTTLLLLYAAGVAWVWRREQEPPAVGEIAEPEAAEPGDGRHDRGGKPRTPGRPLLFLLLGFLGMVLGGVLAVRGAQGLVDLFDVSESVIGLTVLALATSAEMVALVWASYRQGVTELVVAGATGAVAYNATVSVGVAAVVSPLAIGRGSVILVLAVVTAALPLLLLTGRRTGALPRVLGPALVIGYVAVVGWLFAG